MRTLQFFILFACILEITASGGWCYQSQTHASHCTGPQDWKNISETCGGRRQSPINIIRKDTINRTCLEEFTFEKYLQPFTSSITNNGHTVKISLPGTALISKGYLSEVYKAVDLHFHWGNTDGTGSEHTIDGKQYPMEMHIVHIKKRYSGTAEAVKDPYGLAVLGFFFEVSESANLIYEPIIKTLEHIEQPGNYTKLDPLSLQLLIPSKDKLKKYFRYEGSLTTPNCDEAVIWTVFETPIKIGKHQLSEFFKLKFEHETPMVDNFRPVQSLNDRAVYYSISGTESKSTREIDSGSHMATGSSILVISTILTTYFWSVSV